MTRSPVTRWLLAVVIACAGMATTAHSSPTGIRYSDVVGFVHTIAEGGFSYSISCHAPAGTVYTNLLIQTGAEQNGSMLRGGLVEPPHSGKGHFVQVDGSQYVWEERTESQGTTYTAFWAGGSVDAPESGEYTAYVGFAMWGVGDLSPSQCTASVRGVNLPIAWYSGDHAAYVGPEAFGSGVFYQDGGLQVGLARTYRQSLYGGPVLAFSLPGDDAAAVMTTDSVSGAHRATTYWRPSGPYQCAIGDPAATSLTLDLVVGDTTGGRYTNELWWLAVPPTA